MTPTKMGPYVMAAGEVMAVGWWADVGGARKRRRVGSGGWWEEGRGGRGRRAGSPKLIGRAGLRRARTEVSRKGPRRPKNRQQANYGGEDGMLAFLGLITFQGIFRAPTLRPSTARCGGTTCWEELRLAWRDSG